MAESNEILAVFRADIEQYKKDVGEAAAITGTLDKKVEATGATTQKFDKQTKGAAGSISTLSKGLGGLAGLLGITGKLFGVNTDQIQELIFTSQQFGKIAKQFTDVQRASNLATKEGIAVKEADIVVTEGQSVAQKLYALVVGQSTGAMAAFKVALAATGIGLAVIALTTLVSSFQAAKKATEDKEKAAKKLREENNKLNESIVEVQKKEDELALSRGVATKLITERQAEEIKATTKNLETLQKIRDEQKVALNKDGVLERVEDELTKQKRIVAERDYQTDLQIIKEKFDAIDRKEREKLAKEDAEEDAANKKAGEEAWKEYLEDIRQIRQKDFHQTQLDEAERQKISIAKQITDFKEREEAQKQFTSARIKALTGLDEEEKRIAIEAIKTRIKLKIATEEEILALGRLEKEVNDKRIDAAKQVADAIFKAQQEAFDKRQELLQKEVDLQESNIETQRRLAEAGLTNTLAFEERKSAELQRQQLLEAQKQKRVKLLEVFLNSLAEFSKEPGGANTALQKALLQVALAQAATAVFAEEGGIIGEIGERSNLSRRHKGGGDVLLHAQKGEGIFSRDEMSNLGRRNFHLLKDAARFPIKDDVFGMPKIALAGGSSVSNADVVKELKALQHIVKNKRESHFEVDQFGNYIKTSIENGVTEATKGKLPKPRFR